MPRFSKFILLSLFIFPAAVLSQEKFPETMAASQPTPTIYLARDDGTGEAGEPADSFLTTDVPIYCVVMLSADGTAVSAAINVKMNFIAVKVAGVRPETKVVSAQFTTNGTHDRVRFTGRPDKRWVAGTYRTDIFINGKPAGRKDFVISEPARTEPMPAAGSSFTGRPKAARARGRKN